MNRYSKGRPVFLVGEWWGGTIATWYIDQYVQFVAGAVPAEPGPRDGTTMERLKGDLKPIDLNPSGSTTMRGAASSSLLRTTCA